MKRIVIRLTLGTLFFLACEATPMLADGGGIPPLCWPRNCQARIVGTPIVSTVAR
jgi:hypothetical protein